MRVFLFIILLNLCLFGERSYGQTCDELLNQNTKLSDLYIEEPAAFFRSLVSIPFRAAFIRAYEQITNEWIEPPYSMGFNFDTEVLSPSSLNFVFNLKDQRLFKDSANFGIKYIKPEKLAGKLVELDPYTRLSVTEYALQLLTEYFTIYENAEAKIEFDEELQNHDIDDDQEREILKTLSLFNGRRDLLASLISTLLSEKKLFGMEREYSSGRLTPEPLYKDLLLGSLTGVLVSPISTIAAATATYAATDSGVLSIALGAMFGLIATVENYAGYRKITTDSQRVVNDHISSSVNTVSDVTDVVHFSEVPMIKATVTPSGWLFRLFSKDEKPVVEGSSSRRLRIDFSENQGTYDPEKYKALFNHYNKQIDEALKYLNEYDREQDLRERLRMALDNWRSIKIFMSDLLSIHSSLIDEITECKNKCQQTGLINERDLEALKKRVFDVDAQAKALRNYIEKQKDALQGLRRVIIEVMKDESYETAYFSDNLKEMAHVELQYLSFQISYLETQLEGEFLYQLVSSFKQYLMQVEVNNIGQLGQ